MVMMAGPEDPEQHEAAGNSGSSVEGPAAGLGRAAGQALAWSAGRCVSSVVPACGTLYVNVRSGRGGLWWSRL